ncbi:hypothetical protein ZWY2020_019370 [Hordeum vulgare]|nr:hypothetical protein ZWY2020_019370 [Hordeum vulgare]
MSSPESTPCGSNSARGTYNGVDRLSSLPSELLHRVMSFLPMPEAVRTSLLSPSWRYLWASTPYIRIDHHDFMEDDDKMDKFGNHLLLLRDSTASLDEARIVVRTVASTTCTVWIRHVIMHKVRHLHVSGLGHLDSSAMPPSHHLKTIRLHFVILGHGLFRPLNYDCRVLQLLQLEDCVLVGLKEISSRSLKVLRIINCLITGSLLICASNLTHLSILDMHSHSGAILARDLSSLVTAFVSVRTIEDHALLDGLSHATTLELHAPLLERGLWICPMFNNLTSLLLGHCCMAADFDALLQILQRSPKLKEFTLNLKRVQCIRCMHSKSTSPPSRVVYC